MRTCARNGLFPSPRRSPDEGYSKLLNRRDDPRDVLRAGEAMVAILDHGEHHVVAGQPVRQREGMLPWHVRVLRALQDAHRAADLDCSAEQKVIAALLDQCARDRIGLAILRWPEPHAFALDL